MKSTQKPVRDPKFELHKVNEEYQLFNTTENTVVYINDTAAVIWQLCDGTMKVSEVKSLLKDSYPESKAQIGKDVDEALVLLSNHGAIDV